MGSGKKGLLAKAGEALRTLVTRRIAFEFENLPVVIRGASYRRIGNWLAAELAVMARARRPWGMPTHVQIETSTKCNQRCQYCPVGQELAAQTGHLAFETYQRFADAHKDTALLFQLWGWGEPFLNRDIFAMIGYARKLGIPTVSSSNGQLFAQPEMARQVVESGLDYLIVSVSGISQETYGRFRPGSEWGKVGEGLRNIAEEKRRQGVRTPFVSLTFVVSKANEHETGALPAMARELGVDAYSLKRLNPASTRSEKWAGDEYVAGDERFVRLRYENGERVRTKHNKCKALWQGTTLRSDGRVNACAYDFHGKETLGHAGREEFVQIWTGKEYERMREQFGKDWNQISICKDCIYAFEGGSYEEAFAETVLLAEPAMRQG